ncbi:MAG: hypothetical protein JW866_08815, partial [Ignavibacteriales bacterium]|nr:hypothetical protein [Ignavibacteriales bacterium]
MKDSRLKTSLEIIGIFIIIIWGVEIIDIIFPGSFHEYGIYPRETAGLIGIILAPLIHADFLHLFSNTVPLFFLGLAILYFYPKSSGVAIIIIYLLTG